MTRSFSLLCAIAWISAWLTGCHYQEEELWENCCILIVQTDETSSSEGRIALLKLGIGGFFSGDGRGASWHRDKIIKVEKEVQGLMENDAAARPSDSFTRLGMTCTPASLAMAAVVQCDVDLPVWFRCSKFTPFGFGQKPIPTELRPLMPAVLHMSVDMAGATLVKTGSNVVPVQGGRLCHR